MDWKLKATKEKVKCSYKTLYLADNLIEEIDKIAKDNGTSVNNVIVSMIESCLDGKQEETYYTEPIITSD